MEPPMLFSGTEQCPECHEDVRYENIPDGSKLTCWNCGQVFRVNVLRRELFPLCLKGYDHVEKWANNFSTASIAVWSTWDRDPTPVETCNVVIVEFPINMATHLMLCSTCMHILQQAVIERIALHRAHPKQEE